MVNGIMDKFPCEPFNDTLLSFSPSLVCFSKTTIIGHVLDAPEQIFAVSASSPIDSSPERRERMPKNSTLLSKTVPKNPKRTRSNGEKMHTAAGKRNPYRKTLRAFYLGSPACGTEASERFPPCSITSFRKETPAQSSRVCIGPD